MHPTDDRDRYAPLAPSEPRPTRRGPRSFGARVLDPHPRRDETFRSGWGAAIVRAVLLLVIAAAAALLGRSCGVS